MELGTLNQQHFSAEAAVECGKVLAKKFGCIGVVTRAVGNDWVFTAEGKEPVAPRPRKGSAVEVSPSDPADVS